MNPSDSQAHATQPNSPSPRTFRRSRQQMALEKRKQMLARNVALMNQRQEAIRSRKKELGI